MKKKSLTKILTAALLTLTVALTGCGGSGNSGNTDNLASESAATDEQEPTTIRLGVMTGNADAWLAAIGKETGIYEKHGLDIQVTEFAAGINTVDAITTNQIDIGQTADFAGINRIGNTVNQTTLRYFAGITYQANTKLYVNPEKIKTVEDLKGKNIITLLGTVWEYWNASAVQSAGYTNDDVVYKAVDSMQDGLAVAYAGDADAFFASGENARRLEEYGWTSLLDQSELGLTTYALYMANQEYLDANKDTVVDFLEATQEIMDYIANNTDAAADIMNDQAGLEQDVFKNQVAAVHYRLDITQDAYDGLKKVAEWTQANGYYENAFDIADFLNTDALSEAYPDKITYKTE